MSAIVVNDLNKKIGGVPVFTNFNLEVEEGEFFAILAGEGKGKSTLCKILFNFLKPGKGKCRIFGLDVVKDAKDIREIASVVHEDFLLNENIRGVNLLRRTLKMHNIQNTDEMESLIDYFGINPKQNIMDMSFRDRKLLSIINALIVKPRLVVMDQPSKDLDPETVNRLFSYLKNRKDDMLTLLLLTDSLAETQLYCDRAGYLHDGKIMEIEYLKDRISNDKIVKIMDYEFNPNPFYEIGARLIKNIPGDHVFFYNGNLNDLARALYTTDLKNFNVVDSTLDDKIKALYDNVNLEYVPKKIVEPQEVVQSYEDTYVEDTILHEESEYYEEPEVFVEREVIESSPIIVDESLNNEVDENFNLVNEEVKPTYEASEVEEESLTDNTVVFENNVDFTNTEINSDDTIVIEKPIESPREEEE